MLCDLDPLLKVRLISGSLSEGTLLVLLQNLLSFRWICVLAHGEGAVVEERVHRLDGSTLKLREEEEHPN